jgi:hypothetical protein
MVLDTGTAHIIVNEEMATLLDYPAREGQARPGSKAHLVRFAATPVNATDHCIPA